MRTLAALAISLVAATAAADNVILVHHGRLLTSGDQPVDGGVDITIRLYSKSDGLSSDIVWFETYTVTAKDGFYSIAIGDPRLEKKPLTANDVKGDRFLAVAIGSTEFSPRFRLGTVPTAIDAQNLGGKPASDYALKADVSTDAQKLGGKPATDYALKSELSTDATTLAGKAANLYALKSELSTDAATLAGKAANLYALKSEVSTDALTLEGKSASAFALANHNHDGVYLKATGGGDLAISGTGTMGFLGLTSFGGTIAACDASKAGTVYFSAADKAFYGCDGERWNSFASTPIGTVPTKPGTSCKDIKTKNGTSLDGVYWIKPDSGSAYQAYCDMTRAGGGWTLVFNLDTNDSVMRGYGDTGFWTTGGNTVGSVATALQNDFKGVPYGNVVAGEMMVWAHVEGSDLNTPSAWARYQLVSSQAGKSMLQLLALANNTTITGNAVERSGKVVTAGAFARTAGDVFIDNGLPIIVNSTGAGTGDAQNTVRIGTQITPICPTIDCNGHNVQGGYGGYHIRPSSGGYPLTYEAMPSFGYHNTPPIGFGDNFVNNNGCGNSVWTNTCGPETVSGGVRLQVDFAIYVR